MFKTAKVYYFKIIVLNVLMYNFVQISTEVQLPSGL